MTETRHHAMLLLRSRPAWALAASAVLVAGCYVPAPASHAVLQVPASGTYMLDGTAVEAADLPRVLTARQAQAPSLVLEIHASPQASSASIQSAVSAARLARVRVAFASADAGSGPLR
jgi:biopolymer transport protein ExbD